MRPVCQGVGSVSRCKVSAVCQLSQVQPRILRLHIGKRQCPKISLSCLSGNYLFICLRGRERGREKWRTQWLIYLRGRERKCSSICWFAPPNTCNSCDLLGQTTVEESWKLISGFPQWVARTQLLECSPSASQSAH